MAQRQQEANQVNKEQREIESDECNMSSEEEERKGSETKSVAKKFEELGKGLAGKNVVNKFPQ